MFRFLNVGLNLKVNLPFVVSYIMRTNAPEWGEIWERQFSRVLSHDLHWEYKPYKLKRSYEIQSSYLWLEKKCIRAFQHFYIL